MRLEEITHTIKILDTRIKVTCGSVTAQTQALHKYRVSLPDTCPEIEIVAGATHTAAKNAYSQAPNPCLAESGLASLSAFLLGSLPGLRRYSGHF